MKKINYFILILLFFAIPTATNAQTWTQKASDIDGEAAGDLFGTSVSLSSDGSTVAVGAAGNDGNGSNSGHVRIYQLNSGTWTQIGADIDGEAADDYFGTSISLSSDGLTVAVGARGNDGVGSFSGHVRIYRNNSGAWEQIGSDINGEAAGDNSGMSVSLSSDGSTVAVGANGNESYTGHVRVYQNNSGIWTQTGADIDGEAASDESGISVSLSSDGLTVAVGAYYNDGNGTDAGHVRVYQNNSGTWTQIGADIDGEAANDYFGWSVSLSSDGSTVAVGAYENDGNDINSGHVRIYQINSGTWTQIGADIDGEAADDYFGTSISLSSDCSTVAVGAVGNDENGSDAGHVRVLLNPFIGISDVSKNDILIYPNPTKGVFTIKLPGFQYLSGSNVSVTDISGKKIFIKTISSSELQVDISNYPSGVYFVKISNTENVKTVKIVKQ